MSVPPKLAGRTVGPSTLAPDESSTLAPDESASADTSDTAAGPSR
jgi:hypothetical protein